MSSRSARRSRPRSGRVLAVVGVAVALVACVRPVTSVRPGPVVEPIGDLASTRPSQRHTQVPEVSQDSLLKLLDERRRAVSTLRALVRIESREGALTGTIQMRPPEHVRFQGLDPLGRTAFDFISRGEDAEVYLAARREVIRGRLEALEREAGADPHVSLTDLLTAAASLVSPLVDVEEVAALEMREGRYLLNVFLVHDHTARFVRRLTFEGERLLLVREEVFGPTGAPRAVFTFEDFRMVGGEWRSHRLTLARPGASPTPVLTVQVLDLVVNGGLTQDAFALGPVPGVTVREAVEPP